MALLTSRSEGMIRKAVNAGRRVAIGVEFLLFLGHSSKVQSRTVFPWVFSEVFSEVVSKEEAPGPSLADGMVGPEYIVDA